MELFDVKRLAAGERGTVRDGRELASVDEGAADVDGGADDDEQGEGE